MKKLKVLAICAIAVLATTSIRAQGFSTGADLVSSYVWRGIPQEGTKGTPNIQPYASYTIGGFTIGAWASSSFIGNVKEVDLYATYAISSLFSVTVTDYNWGFTNSYFNYGTGTDHNFEGTFSYAGVEAFPLSVSINTMFYGADKTSDTTNVKNAYSTYVELAYPIAENAKIFVGASLFDSPYVYANTGFAVTNVGIKVNKLIPLTDKFSLPVYGIVGANPYAKSAFFVAGITL